MISRWIRLFLTGFAATALTHLAWPATAFACGATYQQGAENINSDPCGGATPMIGAAAVGTTAVTAVAAVAVLNFVRGAMSAQTFHSVMTTIMAQPSAANVSSATQLAGSQTAKSAAASQAREAAQPTSSQAAVDVALAQPAAAASTTSQAAAAVAISPPGATARAAATGSSSPKGAPPSTEGGSLDRVDLDTHQSGITAPVSVDGLGSAEGWTPADRSRIATSVGGNPQGGVKFKTGHDGRTAVRVASINPNADTYKSRPNVAKHLAGLVDELANNMNGGDLPRTITKEDLSATSAGKLLVPVPVDTGTPDVLAQFDRVIEYADKKGIFVQFVPILPPAASAQSASAQPAAAAPAAARTPAARTAQRSAEAVSTPSAVTGAAQLAVPMTTAEVEVEKAQAKMQREETAGSPKGFQLGAIDLPTTEAGFAAEVDVRSLGFDVPWGPRERATFEAMSGGNLPKGTKDFDVYLAQDGGTGMSAKTIDYRHTSYNLDDSQGRAGFRSQIMDHFRKLADFKAGTEPDNPLDGRLIRRGDVAVWVFRLGYPATDDPRVLEQLSRFVQEAYELDRDIVVQLVPLRC